MRNSKHQFQFTSTIVRHTGDYTGDMGELSINTSTNQLLLHDGCTCNGVAFAQLELTECAAERAEG